ncbi:hypothetical protein BDP27DRAFT_1292119 [Rhodocollybia butyracea]|uniref:YCII-related domain-containing protein n=1 Tax=Rhodocollybia butyracea TaxID=206335 RepID=A0A9P5PZH3_9AGAR|nr:hypothetical protein BDP27DRAFT_1292119 [Rhodocollybia butyracea]
MKVISKSFFRFISMSNPARPKFFVYAPDKTEEGTFAKRKAIRNEHLVRIRTVISSGMIRVGGVLLTPESASKPPEEQKMIGSTLIFEADSLEEVRKIIEEDVYYKEGVWDPEKLVILPMLAATPIP